jgi:pilus assembly protein CpaE
MRHDSGLHVLAAPPTPELANLVEARHVEALLTTILGSYDAIVVDAGSVIDERTMAVFDKADTIVLPVYPEIPALKAVRSLLDYLNESGSSASKTTFVLNNTFAREILRLRDVESALGMKIGAELAYDPFVYLKAVNEGVPVVDGAPRSSAAERLTTLSETAFGGLAAALSEIIATPRRKPRKLGGLLRRS